MPGFRIWFLAGGWSETFSSANGSKSGPQMPVQKAPAGWGLMLDHSHCFFYRNRPPNRPRPGQIGPSGRPKIGRKRI